MSFVLAVVSFTCLLFLAGNKAYSFDSFSEEESKEFELHTTINFDGSGVMDNFTTIDEIDAEMMERVEPNINRSMLRELL